MDFSEALAEIKNGRKLYRHGWKGEGMFLFLVNGSNFLVSRAPLNSIFDMGTEIEYNPHIDMRFADGNVGVWSPSNADLLEADWEILD